MMMESNKKLHERITVQFMPDDIGLLITDEYEQVCIDLSKKDLIHVINFALFLDGMNEEVGAMVALNERVKTQTTKGGL